MAWWALTNCVLYVATVGLSYAAIRHISAPLRLIIVAWVVVAVKYVPFGYQIARDVWSGKTSATVLSTWPVCSALLTLLIVPASSILVWCGREDLAALGLVVIAANWLLFEVLGTRLVLFTWPMWTWGLPLLSVCTLVVLGGAALSRVAGGRRTRG